MKLIWVFSLFCLALVSKEIMGELVKVENVAWRWPGATASCPPGKRMLAGGGNCRSQDGRGWTFLAESRPISINQYTVRCDTPEQQNIIAEAYVVCE
ncbi:shufflon protein B'-like [Sitodiplosis mosellana]|uniref:shufflon protein B'-like n=1 Tax=Sitodiplosis mosellana TaxID=263140 RepID=UPI0024444BC4|nr:shufflon protein B'-like [Sitodiplosis mosellana]